MTDKTLQRKSKKPFSDTVIKTRRGAGADARARTKGKGKSVPDRPEGVLPKAFRPELRRTTIEKNNPSPNCAAVEESLPPEHVATLARLADVFNMSTAAMRDLRARDPLFPPKTGQGYSVFGLAHLLRARALERQSDEDFESECREDARARLADLDAGRWADLGADFVAKLREAIQKTIAEAAAETSDELHARRKACIADALDDLRRCIEGDAQSA